MENTMREHKHVRVSPATHRRLRVEAAMRGRTASDLADELLAKGLRELPPVQQVSASIVPQAA